MKPIKVQVRFKDLDVYGHVNESIYYQYMLQARWELLKNEFDKELLKTLLIVVAHSECTYKQPITTEDFVYISVGLGDIGKKSFTLVYNIFNADKLYAVGKTTLVCFDAKTSKTIEIPNWLKEKLQELGNE